MIDFLFGDRQSPQSKFGSSLVSEYDAIEMSIVVNGEPSSVSRTFGKSGSPSRFLIGSSRSTPDSFNDWIHEALEWPHTLISRGTSVNAASGVEELSFRTIFRHVYRRADSWTSFASQEFPHHRRAVTAFLSGIADVVYSRTRVEQQHLTARIADLESERLRVRSIIDSVVKTATEGFRQSGVVSLDTIDAAEREVDEAIAAESRRREELGLLIRESPDYDESLDSRLAALEVEIGSTLRDVDGLNQAITDQERLSATLEADLQRIERASSAAGLFSSLRVTMCPACFQAISAQQSYGTQSTQCYLCHQHVSDDARLRRLELEATIIHGERDELGGAIADLTKSRLALEETLRTLERDRTDLLAHIDRHRQDFLAPFLTELEQIQYRIGQLSERRLALLRLRDVRRHVADLDEQIRSIENQISELQTASNDAPIDFGLARRRCSMISEIMNQFISDIPSERGVFGPITLVPQSVDFYVGSDQWNAALGNERRVLFLLAYHYAQIVLATEENTPHPMVIILDNPFQQDVPDDAVEQAIQLLSSCCARDSRVQIIIATRRQMNSIDANRIQFTHQFNPVGLLDESTRE
jgi:hypothetical protein